MTSKKEYSVQMLNGNCQRQVNGYCHISNKSAAPTDRGRP